MLIDLTYSHSNAYYQAAIKTGYLNPNEFQFEAPREKRKSHDHRRFKKAKNGQKVSNFNYLIRVILENNGVQTPHIKAKVYASEDDERQAILDRVISLLDIKELVKVKYLVTKIDSDLKLSADFLFNENSMRKTTNNRKLFNDVLKHAKDIKYNEKDNSVELQIKRERKSIIIQDLDSNVTKEQLSQHLNDNHLEIAKDSQLDGVWYVHYPDEASAIKAAMDHYDTQIGTGDKSFLKISVKPVTKENIKNELLDEHVKWVEDHRPPQKEFEKLKAKPKGGMRSRIHSVNFPTLPASRDARTLEKKFDEENILY